MASVAVVGGGFSGLLTALHLLEGDRDLTVRLVEMAERFGLGRAYAASTDELLLNVRAANMSAFAAQPEHFVEWLSANGGGEGFVSRRRYGEYLQALLRDAVGEDGHPGRLLLEHDEVVDIAFGPDSAVLTLAVGRTLAVDAVVLATGLAPAEGPGGLAMPQYAADPWRLDPAAIPSGDVLLIGSGLTMVDAVLSLSGPGAETDARRFVIVSRRGRLPLVHGASAPAPLPHGALDTPRQALRRLRAHAQQVGWRSAVDSLRPLTPALWARWTLAERRRFLRHARAFWDVHRHRMAPQAADQLARLAHEGRLTVVAARIAELRPEGDELLVRWRRRGQSSLESRRFRAAINCTGLSGDLDRLPLTRRLRDVGAIRPDPLALGLEVDEAFRVVDREGRVNRRFFAVGPLTRGARWESVAVPDLRTQTEEVAANVRAALNAP